MTVDDLKEAIVHLPEPERKKLADWLEEMEEDAWDREMESDFSPGGRGVHLLDEVKSDIAAGRTKPMEEFLAEAKAKREQPKIGR